jgi:hypothetical protein
LLSSSLSYTTTHHPPVHTPSSTAITTITTNMAAKQNHTDLKADALPHSEV